MKDKIVRHSLSVPSSIVQKANILAATKGTTISQMYEIFIEKEYEKSTITKRRN